MTDAAVKPNLKSKPEVEVSIYLDNTDADNPYVLNAEEEAKLDLANLPKTIFVIKSRWIKPTWTINNIIEMNQYSEKLVQGRLQRVFDVNALVTSRIRCLLKYWNIAELESEFELKFEDSIDARGIKILSAETMNKIGGMHPPGVINALYNKAMEKLFPEEAKQLKNLIALAGDQKT